MSTCKVEGCNADAKKPGTAKGFCQRHYTRFKKYGDPRKGSIADPNLYRWGVWRLNSHGQPDRLWEEMGMALGVYGFLLLLGRQGSLRHATWPSRSSAPH